MCVGGGGGVSSKISRRCKGLLKEVSIDSILLHLLC